MKDVYDLSKLQWRLSGWAPHYWRLVQTMELGVTPNADVMAVPARVPGSVQEALRDAGIIPDWNVGDNARACEWVENRQWIYEATIPGDWLARKGTVRLECLGLDYCGEVVLNGQSVGEFVGTHVPHVFDVTRHLREGDNVLRILFDLPPRWLGQFGYTSRVKEWKVRFNYTWDWQPRLVQVGIWDAIRLVVTDGHEIEKLRCVADADPDTGTGLLRVAGRVTASPDAVVRVRLHRGGLVVREETVAAATFNALGLSWRDLPVLLWWPNQEGEQSLYQVDCTLVDGGGAAIDTASRRVGFRHVEWRQCEGSPAGADPWLCVVNGRPVFLQGVNFPPVLPNFADLTREHYRKRLDLYRDLGCNLFRVNGVGYLEFEWFYDLCDELGLMVWQDVPISSSGVDNYAPDDEKSIREVGDILVSYIGRRQHHPCLIVWCGGNELQKVDSEGRSVPLDLTHPMLAHLSDIVSDRDPTRRFLATTSTGPRFGADASEFGKGLHWDVHGPWKPWDDLTGWDAYWAADDALFRSETGAPGTCSAEVIRQYAGELDPMPVSPENPLWRRPVTWWIEDAQFAAEHGRAPQTLEEYVDWSQARQARALVTAVRACKERFPRCGGVLLWCGHDCFPCPANTSIIDVRGDPKPAALALREVWRTAPPGRAR